MKLIADSGSTKTEWRILEKEKIRSYRGPGLNPIFLTSEEIEEEFKTLIEKEKLKSPEEIHFYGAGVATEKGIRNLENAFKSQFSAKSRLFINDDLLGASRALFGNKSGIACILGTGSNSCLYNKGLIQAKVPALGYILGDEGSGTDIGKRFLNALLKNDFEKALSEKIFLKADFSISKVIESTYREAHANRYLASFTHLVREFEKEEEIRNIVKESFLSFLKKNVFKYENYRQYSLGFAGSVAFHFRNILKEVLVEEGISDYRIIEHPIEELVKYHMNN